MSCHSLFAVYFLTNHNIRKVKSTKNKHLLWD